MKEKFLAALHKMKREQMVIWLLLLALAVVIFWPVDSGQEDVPAETAEQEETDAGTAGPEQAMEHDIIR